MPSLPNIPIPNMPSYGEKSEETGVRRKAVKNAAYFFGVLLMCSLIGYAFHTAGLSEANIMSVYVLGILLISAATSEMIYGIFASIAGMLLFNCLYASPVFTFNVYDSQYTITAIIMLGASIVVGSATQLLRHYLKMEKLSARRSALLLETSRGLQKSQCAEDVLEVVAERLSALSGFGASIIPISENGLPDKDSIKSAGVSDETAFLETEGFLKELIKSEKTAPVKAERKNASEIYMKIEAGGKVFAIVKLTMKKTAPPNELEMSLIRAIIDEAAQSIEKYRLREINEKIAREAEAQRLRANLLRTISHDLRTPLTSISGNADILLNNEDQLNGEVKKQLYQDMLNDANWLIALVENLLSITRIEDGRLSIKKEAELLQDVVEDALSRLGRRIDSRTVKTKLSDELVMAEMDTALITQVIVNFMDNAVKYTKSEAEITISVFRRGNAAVLEVSDNGDGISDSDKEKIFDMFYTANNRTGDGRRGMGLGLSLCKSIITAHGGKIYVKDNEPRGTVVGFELSAKEVNLEYGACN